MSREGWILVAAGVALLVIGGGTVAVITIDKRRMAALLRAAFQRHGLPPAWGEALGRQESGLDSSAVSPKGAADDKLGRAWGATQITAELLRQFGGPSTAELLRSPELQAETTAALVENGAALKRINGTWSIVFYGKPATIEDMGAVWNAGRRTFAELEASHVTRKNYVPSLRVHLARALATEGVA